MTLTPPAGWSARRCAQGSRLTGTTGSTGRVYLKICSSRSGGFRVKTSAPVPTGTVTLRVRRVAPLPPAHVSAHAVSYGHLAVAWSRPTYSGGVAVTGYRVTLTASGQKTRTYVFRTSALTSGLTHTFGSLPHATVWRATVAAINEYGTGNGAAAARVRVL